MGLVALALAPASLGMGAQALKPLIAKYQLAPSRWNQSRGSGKCTIRFQATEPTFDADDEVAAAPADPYGAVGDWACLEYSLKRAVIISALDSES